MGARATASVVMSLGTLNIGVKLYLSASSNQVSFNMINPDTGNRVKQLLVDADDVDEEGNVKKGAKPIARNSTLSGYEYAKDEIVTFTKEEVASMQAEKSNTLALVEFIPCSEINPIQIEKTFYTGPDKGMDRSYKLLYKVLKETGQAAVGTWVSRSKEHLVTIRAHGPGLVIHQMFYNSEVRAFDDNCADIEPSSLELAMTKALIKKFSKKTFDSTSYSDKFIEKVSAAAQVKLDGGEITSAVVKKAASGNVEAGLTASLKAMGMSDAEIQAIVDEAALSSGDAEPTTAKAKPAKKVSKKKATKKKATA